MWKPATKEEMVDLGTFGQENRIARASALKVTVPLGINLVEFGRTKQNQTGSHWYKRKLSRPKSNRRSESTFQTAKRFQYFPFGRNRLPKRRGVYDVCRLQACVRSVAHKLCYLNAISKLSTIDMIALGATWVILQCRSTARDNTTMEKSIETRKT